MKANYDKKLISASFPSENHPVAIITHRKTHASIQGSWGSTFEKSLTPSLAIPFSDDILLNWSFYFLRQAELIHFPRPLRVLFLLPGTLLPTYSHFWNHLYEELSTQKSPPPHFFQHLFPPKHISIVATVLFMGVLVHCMASPPHSHVIRILYHSCSLLPSKVLEQGASRILPVTGRMNWIDSMYHSREEPRPSSQNWIKSLPATD